MFSCHLVRAACAALALTTYTVMGAAAASLSVSPVTLDVVAKADAATSLRVLNRGAASANFQVRVMRWTQLDGQEVLEPTDAVVASPPIAQIGAGEEQTIRVVRLSKAPIRGEEAFRLLVDELPTAGSRSSTSVHFVVRQSIPVFFTSPEARSASLTFGIAKSGGNTVLVGRNTGETYHRILELNVRDTGGRTQFAKDGLVGYILGGSSFQWNAPRVSKTAATASGRTNRGDFDIGLNRK